MDTTLLKQQPNQPARKCDVADCITEAIVNVHLCLRSSAKQLKADLTAPVLCLCEEHSEEITFAKLCTPQSWPDLLKAYYPSNKTAPKLKYSTLTFSRIEREGVITYPGEKFN